MDVLRSRVLVVLLAIPALSIVPGCGSRPGGDDDGKPAVVVSIVPQAWLVEQIAQEYVDVITIVKPGDSPATYQPTDADVSRVMGAAVYFRIGVPFENGPWFEAIQGSERLKIVDVRRNIRLRRMARHADHGSTAEHGGNDPHIWLSPRLLKVQAQTVLKTLAELDPAHEEDFRRNLKVLDARLDEVDRAVRTKLEPFQGKVFFVFHPAWGYFADQYHLRQVAVELEGKDPSDYELTRLQKEAKKEGVRVVFVQPQISSKSADAVAAAIGGRVEKIDPLQPDPPAALLKLAEALAKSYR